MSYSPHQTQGLSNASIPEEEIVDRDQSDTRHSTSEGSHRPCNLPQQVSDHLPADSSTGPHQAATTEYNTSDENTTTRRRRLGK